MFLNILILIFLFFFPTIGRTAQFDPSFDFSTIETAHFQIYYHQGIEAIAERSAATAEDLHGKLTNLLQWTPEGKTHIIIADNSDFANGMATVTPYNAIYLQTAPPSIASSIGEYDDWLRLLIAHEYAHILTSDPVRGYSSTMRRVFGKTVPVGDLLTLLTYVSTGPPNTMMPRWWHEGMATWAETELTRSGRGRSSYYQMLYRAAVLENNLLSIDRINGDIPYWPEGNSPYIFGSALIQYIANKYGKEMPGEISIRQSGRFPYFINNTIKDTLGVNDYVSIYTEMLSTMALEQQEKISVLQSEPPTITRKVNNQSALQTNPRFSPNGMMIAYNSDDRHTHPRIVIQSTGGDEITSIRRRPGTGTITWTPDSKSIIFSQAERSLGNNYYQDIFRFNIDSKEKKRVTRGMRVSDADVSADGTRIVAVFSAAGGQNIGIIPLTGLVDENATSLPVMLTDFREHRISSPRWSPDGRNIVFAQTDRNGRSSIQILQVDSGASTEIIHNSHLVDAPVWTSDGKSILYTANATGVFNIFRFDLETSVNVQITHLLTGGFTPDASPEGDVVIGEYSSRGMMVSLISRKDLRNKPSPSPSINAGVYPVSSLANDGTPSKASASPPRPYSPLPTLLPKFWIPTLIPETNKDSAIGAMTAGQDVLGYHSMIVKAAYGTTFDRGYFDSTYQYGRYTPSYTLHGYSLPVTYSNLLTHGDYTEVENGLLASVIHPLGNLDSGFYISGGYHIRKHKHLTEGNLQAFDGKEVFEGRRNSFFAGINYNSTLRYPWSITSEEGRNIAGKIEYFGKISGSKPQTREYTGSWEEFIPLTNHHNLMTKMSGGFADGEQISQQSFQLGGPPALLNPFSMRGYESHFTSGSRIFTGSIEYRLPIFYELKGNGTVPIFMDRLHGAVFIDAGETWGNTRSFKGRNVMIGAGTEMRYDMTIGYWLKITPAIGFAHGFDKPYGTDQIYFTVYANL